MTDTRNDEHLQQQAKALFDSSVEQLDAATLSRLNQGRHKALAELHRPGLVAWGRWAPAAGVAAAAVVAVVMINGTNGEAPGSGAVTASDFEMLLEADSLEMLEDLEFYSWMDVAYLDSGSDVG